MKKFGVIILFALVVLGSAQSLDHSVLSADTSQQTFIAYMPGPLFSENKDSESPLPLTMAPPTSARLPEPAVLFLLGIGMLGLASFRRRFKG